MASLASAGGMSDTSRWPLLVVYGSHTGNAQDAAELLGREAAARHFAPVVCSADVCSPAALFTAPHLVFVVSTAGQARISSTYSRAAVC